MDAPSQGKGRTRQKRRTRSAVLAGAMALLQSGITPTVAQAAEAADVSRRTAYRYFPSQEQLLTEAVLETLRPQLQDLLEAADLSQDVEARLDALVTAMWANARTHESLLRTMIRLTVERPDQKQGGSASTREPRRGYRRIDWIEMALAPVRERLDDERFERLVSALAVCIGTEALIVLGDVRGLGEGQAEDVSRWAARSLLRASLEEQH